MEAGEQQQHQANMSHTGLQVDRGPKCEEAGGEQSLQLTKEVSHPPVNLYQTTSFATGSQKTQETSTANCAKPPRMQFLLTQMRSHLRSESGTDLHKKAFLDVVQMASWEKVRKVTDNGTQNRDSELQGVNDESTLDIPDGLRLEESAGELEASMEALKKEFREQMDLLRTEMQAYTDEAIKSLESKMFSRRSNSHRHVMQNMSSSVQTFRGGGCGLEERHKSLSVPSLVPGKNRVLNQTKTTVTPKVRHSAALARRSKSDTFGSSSERNSSQTLLETSDFKVSISQGSKLTKVAGTLPSSCPLLHPSRNLFHTKVKEK